MPLPGTIAGTVGRFRTDGATLESFSGDRGTRVLDVDGEQAELGTGAATVTGRASTVIEDTEQLVHVNGTNIDIGREEVTRRIGTEFAARGRVAYAESCVEEGGGTFPFTLLSAVANVRCERLNFDTEALRKAWEDDGTLSDTWLAGSKTNGDSTVMAYGEASEHEPSDIGLGYEKAWEGYILRGVIYQSGFVAVYEDLDPGAFLRFATEEVVPFGFIPEDDDDTRQATFKDKVGEYLEDEGYDVDEDPEV
jgi:hypothetical protein